MEPLGLRWVMVQGRPAHVGWFADLPPARRPEARCAHCGGRLVLKLGAVRRHHAAHRPESRCVVTRPETALHSDLKYHVAHHLARAAAADRRLSIRRTCAGGGEHGCTAMRDDVWCDGWDDVRVEQRIATDDAGARRPDIVLSRQGEPVAAIEILVRHAVPADAPAVPWVEVQAHESLVEGDESWHLGTPLPVGRASLERGHAADVWRCPVHASAWAAARARREALRLAENTADSVRTRLVAARVVDVYHPDGARERFIYRMEEEVSRAGHAVVLRRGTRELGREHVDLSDRDSFRYAWRALREAADADAARLTPAGGVRDSPMRWATHDVAASLVEEAMHDMIPGDATPLATRYPRRWFYAREQRRWFLPAGMRGVRWDRAPGDVFASHPAWTASRIAVRERAAPAAKEDGWSTFLFARRPVATDFGEVLETYGAGAIAVVRCAAGDASAETRALVVLSRSASDSDVREVGERLGAGGVECVWLSHPGDWSADRAGQAWVPAGRDERGRGVVLVDGVGVYRADRFAHAFARGDPRVAPELLRARSADRVRNLLAARGRGG